MTQGFNEGLFLWMVPLPFLRGPFYARITILKTHDRIWFWLNMHIYDYIEYKSQCNLIKEICILIFCEIRMSTMNK